MKKSDSVNSYRFNIETVRAALGEGTELAVYVHGELDSTNNEAKRLALSGAKVPALVAAESQTAGRGRLGRSFYSPNGTGAYFSFLYAPKSALENAVSVTGAAAVAVMEAVLELTGKQTDIKWVNDLYLDGKKVCGILTEAISAGEGASYIIVGIGINLSTSAFPAELMAKAGSLGKSGIDRAALIAAVWRRLSPYLRDPADRSWLAPYRAHSCVIGKSITWERGGEFYRGIAVGIDCDGGLEVRLSDGSTQTLRTGEISVFVDPVK